MKRLAIFLMLIVLPGFVLAAPRIQTGINAKVLMDPICPVVTFPSQQDCAPKPYVGRVYVWQDDQKVIGTAYTNINGRFRLRLKPGIYTLGLQPPHTGTTLGGLILRLDQPATSFSVGTIGWTKQKIFLDTGIR